MAKYAEIDLNISPAVEQKMNDLETAKIKGLERVIQEYIDKNDIPFISFSTIISGAILGHLYDAVLAARNDMTKCYPHAFINQLRSNSGTIEVMKKSIEDPELKDVELVIMYSHSMIVLESTKHTIGLSQEVLEKCSGALKDILKELDRRGIVPIRAVLKPIKMHTKYKVITDEGGFIASYDDHLIFSLSGVPNSTDPRLVSLPEDKVIFIGNVQANGDIHHLDDLPIFSTHTKLLFGALKSPIIKPIYMTGKVIDVVELLEVN
jgi:hypothetical protein